MNDFLKMAIKKYCSNYDGIPSACWGNILLNMLNAISLGVCFFLALYFVDVLHLSMVMVGLLMSCYGMGTVVGGILSGKLCDRFSSYLIAIISLIFQSAAFFLLAKCDAFTSLVFILLTLGISAYGFKTANNVSMLNHCKGNQKLMLKVVNISHAASNLGLGLSGIAVGFMAAYGYSRIFYLAGSVLLCSLLYLLFLNKRIEISRLSCKKNEYQNLHYNDNSKEKRDSNLRFLALLSVFFVGIIIAQLGSTYPIYVKAAFPDLREKAVSTLFILDTIIIVLFQAPLANYYKRYNTTLVMGIGGFLMGLGMLVLSFSSSFILALISCAIWTTGEMLFIPTAQLLCYENGEANKKGQSMGVFQSTYALSAVFGPAFGGYVYNLFGMNAMWHLSMLIGSSCFIACLVFIKLPIEKNLSKSF